MATVSESGNEAALVRLALAGDRPAFAALVTPRLGELTSLCQRVAGPALAEDCVQDTLLLALLRLPRLREPGLWQHWLRGIAIRVCRRARARLTPLAPLPADDEHVGRWLPGPGIGPPLDDTLGDTLASADLARSVRAAIASLPEGQRRAIELFYLAGCSYEAAAGALGIPVGALKTRLHKGRAALARYYRLADGPRPLRLDDRTLSVHEAAHAVLGWLEGDRVVRVAITPRAEANLGYVQTEAPRGGLAPAARLVVLMGGEAGVARALPGRPRRDSGDRRQAAQVARSAAGGDAIETALWVVDALEAACERLDDAKTWALVERVSAALVARRHLDADAFRALVTH
jgi:RNA polymerase sigma-70 factor (ECF subfamily)